MKNSLALTLCLVAGCLGLAGCSDADWDHALSYGGIRDDAEATSVAEAPQQQVQAQSQPATAPAPGGEDANAAFCRSVAAQDATSNDFDAATQKTVFARSYAQCLTIYTR